MPGVTARRWSDHFGPRPGGRRARRYADPAGAGSRPCLSEAPEWSFWNDPPTELRPFRGTDGSSVCRARCPLPRMHRNRQTGHRSVTPGRATVGRATPDRTTLGRATLDRTTPDRARLRPEAAVRLARWPTTASPPRAPSPPSVRRRAAAVAAGAGRLRPDLALVDAGQDRIHDRERWPDGLPVRLPGPRQPLPGRRGDRARGPGTGHAHRGILGGPVRQPRRGLPEWRPRPVGFDDPAATGEEPLSLAAPGSRAQRR